MHLQAIMVRFWRHTGRLSSSECGDAIVCCNQARLEEYLEAVTQEAVFREGGAMGAEIQFIG